MADGEVGGAVRDDLTEEERGVIPFMPFYLLYEIYCWLRQYKSAKLSLPLKFGIFRETPSQVCQNFCLVTC